MTQRTPLNPQAALATNRVIWAALLFGQVAFMVVVAVIIATKPLAGPVPEQQQWTLVIINAGYMVTAIPGTYFARAQLFNRGRTNGVVSVPAFGTGNVIFWAGCEGVSFFGLVVALVTHNLLLTAPIIVISFVCQVLTFPKRSDVIASDDVLRVK